MPNLIKPPTRLGCLAVVCFTLAVATITTFGGLFLVLGGLLLMARHRHVITDYPIRPIWAGCIYGLLIILLVLQIIRGTSLFTWVSDGLLILILIYGVLGLSHPHSK